MALLPKLPVETDFSLIWDWLNFLKVETRKDVDSVRPNSPELQKAIDELQKICQNPQEREKYEYREKALRDYINDVIGNYEMGYEKGEEAGLEKGIAKGRERGSRRRPLIFGKRNCKANGSGRLGFGCNRKIAGYFG